MPPEQNKPAEIPPNPLAPQQKKSGLWRMVLFFSGLLLLTGMAESLVNPSFFSDLAKGGLNDFFSQVNQDTNAMVQEENLNNSYNSNQQNSSNAIPLQQVYDTGYTYYLGQLDTPDAPAISDDVKNQITEVLYADNFPKSLLTDTAIVIVNTLTVTSGQFIATPSGNLPVQDFSPEFLTGGGEYATYTDTSGKVIPFSLVFLNKDLFTNGQLAQVLSHELGHHIGSTLTTADWTEYYQLRGIPAGTAGEVANWAASPYEDFAEVYKNIVTGVPIKTVYGFLEPSLGADYAGELEPTCGPIYWQQYNAEIAQNQTANDCTNNFSLSCLTNPNSIGTAQTSKAYSDADASSAVQSCRRNVLDNPSQYPEDWQYGTPYVSTVGPQTKAFIETILNRFN